MATWVGIGQSKRPDSLQAGKEAAGQALEKIGQQRPDLVLVFASVRFEQEALLKGVTSITQDAPMAGCSTAGEILSAGPSRRSVVVMAIRSDTLSTSVGIGAGVGDQPLTAGHDAAFSASQSKLSAPHVFLSFSDGLTGNGAEVMRGIQEVLGRSFPIVGGAAADDFAFKKTYQYFNGKVYTDAAVGVLLAGPISIGIGTRHGWKPLGKPRTVTKATHNIVELLDGHSAVNLYETYFGREGAGSALQSETLADMSIVYPLGMPVPDEEEYLLRNVMRVDPDGALVYAGEIPEGSRVRLMMGSKEKAFEASRRAAQQAVNGLKPRIPTFALAFSSCSRLRLFGHEAWREVAAIRKELGAQVPFAGFYDYGEQAPLTAVGYRGRSWFHNESLVVLAVSTP
ncbi:MAG: hypothetical protein COV76_02965 [Candidatus Omnitrophica bacterium CG11_big_fil_rev_8_21_14_0_20_64_10]|nr:MAG: hypothetical protein COV76_02965 [Candidatus Omnitrophica bacterium CG11_big_fil_rev_8_21_14_0_20_64_10]